MTILPRPKSEGRRNLPVILVLASLGVALSAGVTAVGMHWLAHWDWLSCTVFGIPIAATDPVSVIATFRKSGARGRLLLLVVAFSVFVQGLTITPLLRRAGEIPQPSVEPANR